jgi:hypothetical protein
MRMHPLISKHDKNPSIGSLVEKDAAAFRSVLHRGFHQVFEWDDEMQP